MVVADQSKVLILGFCEDGPYKHAIALLKNPEVKWLPWSYHVGNIDPAALNHFPEEYSLHDIRVAFACWPKNFRGNTSVLRFGRVDHCVLSATVLRMTVLLEDYDERSMGRTITVHDSKVLCFYQKLEDLL